MEDSVYEGDITSRSVIHLASQEVSKYRTPVPVLQPDQSTSKKSTKKRSHSALAVHNVTEDLNISPRALIGHTCKEKLSRKSSVYFPKDDENLQIQLDRRRSRRSLHAPTDQYGDISVEENEDTVERSALPDIADVSAIAGGHKKQKLQLGKLDNRVYSKVTEIKKKHSHAVHQRLPEEEEEEYDSSFWNAELSSSFQQNSRAVSVRTRGSGSGARSDHSHSDSTSNVNLNTKAVKGSPLAEKQKPFTEKRIPHLSSDSDVTLQCFPSEMDGRRKSRTSSTPKTAPNALSVTHPLLSTGTLASSGKHSPNCHSPAKTVPNILPQALHSERQHLPPVSSQRAQTSKFAMVSKRGALSDGSGDADESSNDEEIIVSNQNILLQDIGKHVEMSITTPCHKSVSRRHMSRSPSKPNSSRSVPRDHHANLEEQEEEEEGNEDENFPTSNDIIQFVEISKPTTASPASQKSISSGKLPELPKKSIVSGSESHSNVNQTSLVSEDDACQQEQRISTRKTPSASRKANKLLQNVSSKNLSASVLHNSAKSASVSLSYNIFSHESKDMQGASHIATDSDVEETEADKNEPVFEDTTQGLEPSESVSSHPKSASRASHGAVKSLSSSSSYKIINPPGIDMYASPRIVLDASYQLPHQIKTKTAAREAVNASGKTSNSSKTSEVEHLTSPTLHTTESSLSDPASKKMHSTAIHDDNVMMMETIQENSPQYLGDMSYEVAHQGKIFSRRKISHIPKVSELQKSSLPIRSHASNSITENDTVVQGNTYQIPHQNDISGKTSVSTSRRGKRTIQLSDREQSTSPVPATISKFSGTARKSMCSSATSGHNLVMEDTLLQQQTEEPNRMSRKSVVISRKDRHSAHVSDQEQSPSAASPVKSRVSSTTKKRMHSDVMPDHRAAVEDTPHQASQQAEISGRKAVGTSRKGSRSEQLSDQENSPSPTSAVRPRVLRTARKSMRSAAAVEDTINQMSQQNEISGRKSVASSRKDGQSALVSNQEQSASQKSQTGSRISRTARMHMYSAATPDHNKEAEEDARSQVIQQTEIISRKSVAVSRKDRHSEQISEQEQSTSPTLPARPRISSTARKSMHSARTPSGNATAEDEVRQGARRKTRRAQLSDQEQPDISELPVRFRVSGSTRKRMHSSAAFDNDDVTESQVPGESSSEMLNHTVIHTRKTTDTSSKPSSSKTPLRHVTESSVRSGISDSIRKKMHSTAIPDHDTLMKTFGNRSVSPIRTKEAVVTGRSQRKPASVIHTDFDEEADERSSVSSSTESDHSTERVNERDLPLPPTVQNHDEVAAQSEDRVPATRASRRKKKTTPPRISARETKRIVEHFAGMKLSRGALNSIMESTDLFWQKTFEAVEAYAKHANRDTIEVRDVELLLYRQRHAHDRHSMNALIARYMPMELRSQVIPMATPGNILIP